jgi:hypothetical protein
LKLYVCTYKKVKNVKLQRYKNREFQEIIRKFTIRYILSQSLKVEVLCDFSLSFLGDFWSHLYVNRQERKNTVLNMDVSLHSRGKLVEILGNIGTMYDLKFPRKFLEIL